MLAMAFAAAVLAACSASSSSTATPAPQASPLATTTASETAASGTGTRHLSVQGLELDYPADWSVYDQGWFSTGLGRPLAIIGTLPWGPCAASDINCHYERRLDPGQITVQIGLGLVTGADDICQLGATRPDLAGRGANDPPATGSLTRVDGRPAVRTDYVVGQTDYYHSDGWRDYLIAAPGSIKEAFSIDAKYRGPDLDNLRNELDELIASVRLGDGTTGSDTQGTDCGPPFPS
jgi:hypothetical protein